MNDTHDTAAAPSERFPIARIHALSRLDSLVLLGGSLRPTRLGHAIGRSVMDLPVTPGRSVLGAWQEQVRVLAESLEVDSLPARLVVDRSSARPTLPPVEDRVDLGVQVEPRAYRGTGGLLRDVTSECPPDSYVLVANAGQILVEPLPVLAHALASARSDVSLISHRDGTPTMLMLVRCGCLREVPAEGFHDFKEQILPVLAEKYSVRVVQLASRSGMPLWTLSSYLRALRIRHGARYSAPRSEQRLADAWRSSFKIVENGARVEGNSRIQEAVVLRGARVREGSIVSRSLVCSGGVVDPGGRVVNRIVRAPA